MPALPYAHYFIPDTSDDERAQSLFIDPAAGKSVVNALSR
jgi:hypothetical protein